MDDRVGRGGEILHFAGFTFYTDRAELYDAAGVVLPLRPKVLDLLLHFLARNGQLVRREDLLDAIWPGTTVTDESLSQAVAELRRVLGSDGARLLRTVPRRGYILDAAVTAASSPAGRTVPTTLRPAQHAAMSAMASPEMRVLPHIDPGRAEVGRDIQPFHGVARAGEVPAIAVLPLVNATGDAGDDYFAAGIVDDVILSLGGLRELAVIARGSTVGLAGASADPQALGRSLGARYVLSGSLHRIGRTVRVATRLLDVESGQALWADRQDCAAEQVFDLQDRIVQRVVAGVAPNIHAAELRATLRKRPESLTAYDCMLRGIHLIYATDRATSQQAKAYLEEAIAADPGFALPMAYAAWLHVLWIGQGWAEVPKAAEAAAFDLSRRAIALDPNNALALAVRGHMFSFLRRQHDAALELFDRALAACPNHAFAWMWSSSTLAYLGRAEEAVARAEQALRLSPLDQARYLYDFRLGMAHYAGGNHAEAVRWCQRARSANPSYTANLRILIAALVGAGAPEEARVVAAELCVLEPHFRLRNYVNGLQPFVDPAIRERFLAHLRAARLAE